MNVSAFVEYSSGRQALTLRGQPSDRRQPVHIIFEVDVSDSMTDANKLRSVKCSMEHIVPLLTPDDLVSIITFGENSTILLNKERASSTDTLQYRIKSLVTDGCTNMSAGLMNIQTVLADTPATHKQGVLLLTDGHANRGVSDPAGLKQIVTQLIAEHPEVTLTTVGYGADHNADLLRDMATVGAGSYNVVYNLDNVATVFGVVLGGLTTVVAQNVAVILPPGATAARCAQGYAQMTDAATGETTIRVGDIYAENEIMLLIEAPTGTPIRIQGHNMLTFAQILETLTPTPLTPGEPVPKAIEQTVFRQLVSELLKDATHTSGAARDAIKRRAQDLLRQLQELSYADEQLIQMMIDDVRELTEDLRDSGTLSATVSAQAANHSHYWATGRGVASIAPQLPPDANYGRVYRGSPMSPAPSLGPAGSPPASPPLGAAPAPALRARTSNWDAESSPFINMNMRVTSSALRQASSAAAAPPSGAHDPTEEEQ